MVIEVIIFVGLVIFFTLLGGFYVAKKEAKSVFDWLPHLLSVGTGVLITLAFVEFLPNIIQQNSHKQYILILVGIGVVIIADKFIAPLLGPKHSQSCSHHSHGPQLLSSRVACSSVGCIIVCAFFDGIEIQTAFKLSQEVGWHMALGLLFHVVPEGAIVAGLSLAGGFSNKSAKISVMLIAVSILMGAIIGFLMLEYMNFKETILPLATGILIYVSMVHLLPVAVKRKSGLWGIAFGAAVVMSGHFMATGH
jgi:zinc transporter ZupT